MEIEYPEQSEAGPSRPVPTEHLGNAEQRQSAFALTHGKTRQADRTNEFTSGVEDGLAAFGGPSRQGPGDVSAFAIGKDSPAGHGELSRFFALENHGNRTGSEQRRQRGG